MSFDPAGTSGAIPSGAIPSGAIPSGAIPSGAIPSGAIPSGAGPTAASLSDAGWPVGAATGIGSLPGTDIAEAQRVVLGELPDLPHLAELPARGPGADMIGRGAALLVELPIELYAARWRVATHPGADLRAARDFLERDLDTLTDQASEYDGHIKIQAVGPWTLAAALQLPSGGPLLKDHGAVRDLTASLAEGLRGHVAEARARLPKARVLLQLDEPSLPTVLAGRVPTESGFGTLRPVEASAVRDALSAVITTAGVPVVTHCCAAGTPLGLLREAGAAAVAIDLGNVRSPADLDELGSVVEDGLRIFAGTVSARASGAGPAPGAPEIADRIRGLWRDLGFPAERLAESVTVTPACGLAGASPASARNALVTCRDAARRLREA